MNYFYNLFHKLDLTKKWLESLTILMAYENHESGKLDWESCVYQCLAFREVGNSVICHICRNHFLGCGGWHLPQIGNILESLVIYNYTINHVEFFFAIIGGLNWSLYNSKRDNNATPLCFSFRYHSSHCGWTLQSFTTSLHYLPNSLYKIGDLVISYLLMNQFHKQNMNAGHQNIYHKHQNNHFICIIAHGASIW